MLFGQRKYVRRGKFRDHFETYLVYLSHSFFELLSKWIPLADYVWLRTASTSIMARTCMLFSLMHSPSGCLSCKSKSLLVWRGSTLVAGEIALSGLPVEFQADDLNAMTMDESAATRLLIRQTQGVE
jgi:hypothetical protein